MTKQEKRAKIMELLKWYKGLEEQDVKMAQFVLEQGGKLDEDLERKMKFGRYFPIKDLQETIASVMDIKAVDWHRNSTEKLYGEHDVFDGYVRIDRRRKATYKPVGYTKADFDMIQLVIDRMAEQGFVKVSKTGKGFRVLKCEE